MLLSPSPFRVQVSHQIQRHLLQSLPATRAIQQCATWRTQTCQYPGGCDQPASSCEPHHVQHRSQGGRTSLTNLKDYCWWHHHVVLHELGWILTVHPDGTSQVQSPDGKTIHSHSPPPRPG
jgi:hypothetical protein